MKKQAYLLALPLLMLSCSGGDQPATESTETADTTETVEMIRSDWENEHMLGKVKSFEETPYTPDEAGNIGEMDSCCVTVENYNAHGFMTDEIEKNSAGEITETGVMERDEMGRFMSYTATSNGQVVFKRQMKRGDDGAPIEAMDSDSTGQVTRVHKPDAMNENDQATAGKTYMEDGTYVGSWTFDYVDGQRVSRSWTDSTGVQRMNLTGEVNDKGWLSKVIDVRVSEEGDTTTVERTWTYDSMDEVGNWTQKTKYEDGQPVAVMTRSYTYYEE